MTGDKDEASGIGEILDGKYELLKVIGRGGMSVVYLAMDRKLHKNWAIKEIRTGSRGEAAHQAVDSLIAEADLLKKLDHPALPRIVDILDREDVLYLVMDYVAGLSLETLLAEKQRFREGIVLNWARQLCDVLCYLHSQTPPIIYRDMKPSNIMLQPGGHVKLIDFGIAREYKSDRTKDTVILGTDGYAAPEQYGSSQTDERSDIYSLGMTLYELLTGISPGKDAYQYRYHPMRRICPDLSAGMELIVNHCIAFSPDKRYQSCRELAFDLAHPNRVPKAYQRKERRILRCFYGAAILAVVCAISGSVLLGVDRWQQTHRYEQLLEQARLADIGEAERLCQEASAYPEADLRITEILVDHYLQAGNFGTSEEQTLLASMEGWRTQNGALEEARCELLERIGELYFYSYSGGDHSFRDRVLKAKPYFWQVLDTAEETMVCRKQAESYEKLCSFCTEYVFDAAGVMEPDAAAYDKLLGSASELLTQMEEYRASGAGYVRLTLYREIAAIVDRYRIGMAYAGVDRTDVDALLQSLLLHCQAEQVTRVRSVALQRQVCEEITAVQEGVARAYQNAEKVQSYGKRNETHR